MERTFEVRDMRIKEKFFVDDSYLNGYAKLCGWKASLVYFCLCRHADRNQEAYPSVELMSKKLGVSTRTINRAIADLVRWNIVAVEQEKSQTGKFRHNRYLLKDKKEWSVKPSAVQSRGLPHATQSRTVRHTVKNRTPVSRYKDTHPKDTHIRSKSFLEMYGMTLKELEKLPRIERELLMKSQTN